MSAQQVNAAGGKAFMARPDGWDVLPRHRV